MGKALIPALFVVSAVGVVVLKMGFIFMLLALLPAILSYFVDTDPGKSMFKTVFTCNFAATLPWTIPIVKAGFSMESYNVTNLMTSPTVWMFVYLGAAAGYALVFLCRLIAKFILIVTYEYRIARLEMIQKRLLDEWGDAINRNSTE